MSNQQNASTSTSSHRTPTVYADTVPEIGFGYPVSRLVLSAMTQDNVPNPILTVVIPTPVLIEMAKNFLAAAKSAEAQLQEHGMRSIEVMHSLLADVPVSSVKEDDK